MSPAPAPAGASANAGIDSQPPTHLSSPQPQSEKAQQICLSESTFYPGKFVKPHLCGSEPGPDPISGSIPRSAAPHTAQLLTNGPQPCLPSSPGDIRALVDPAPEPASTSLHNRHAPTENTPLGLPTPAHEARLGNTPSARSRWHGAGKDAWFQFPAEIRNMIYRELLHYPDSYSLYRGFDKQREAFYENEGKDTSPEFPHFDGKLSTPSILLVCKSITCECLPILQSQTLVVDRMGPIIPKRYGGDDWPMMVSAFIGRRTLQAIKHIDIRFQLGQGQMGSGWLWLRIVNDILSILHERNSFETLRVMFKIYKWENHNIWVEEIEVYNCFYLQLEALGARNPNITKPGRIQKEHWLFPHMFTAHRLAAVEDLTVLYDRGLTVRDLRKIGEDKGLLDVRHSPDPNIFVTSHAEFL